MPTLIKHSTIYVLETSEGERSYYDAPYDYVARQRDNLNAQYGSGYAWVDEVSINRVELPGTNKTDEPPF